MWGPLLAYIRKQIGQNTDTSSATGSMSARFNLILASVTASDALQASADTTRSHTSDAYVKKKSMLIPKNGSYRVKFSIWRSGGSSVYGRIYRNGVAYGTERSNSSNTAVEYSEDLFFGAGDECQIYTRAGTNGFTVSLSNFRIYYDLVAGTETPITSYDA